VPKISSAIPMARRLSRVDFGYQQPSPTNYATEEARVIRGAVFNKRCRNTAVSMPAEKHGLKSTKSCGRRTFSLWVGATTPADNLTGSQQSTHPIEAPFAVVVGGSYRGHEHIFSRLFNLHVLEGRRFGLEACTTNVSRRLRCVNRPRAMHTISPRAVSDFEGGVTAVIGVRGCYSNRHWLRLLVDEIRCV